MLLWAVELGRAVVAEDSEHDRVLRDDLELLLEVILVLISPAIDIVGLNIDLEGPVGILFFVAKLIELGQLHD